MTEDWERHLERVEDLGEENPQIRVTYFDVVSKKAYSRFGQNAEELDSIRQDDLPPDMEIEEIDDSEEWKLLTDEIAAAEEAKYRADAYKDIFMVVERTRPDTETYAAAMGDLKERYDTEEVEVDRFASIDVPENIIAETIVEDFDPLLDEVIEEYQ